MKKGPSPLRQQGSIDLRAIVGAGLWIAAAGSLACTLYVGHHNASVLLVLLSAGWVLSPFAGLVWINRVADRGPREIAAAIRASSLVICIASLALYVAVAASRHGHHRAFVFLVLPATSWVTILTMWIAPRLMRRR